MRWQLVQVLGLAGLCSLQRDPVLEWRWSRWSSGVLCIHVCSETGCEHKIERKTKKNDRAKQRRDEICVHQRDSRWIDTLSITGSEACTGDHLNRARWSKYSGCFLSPPFWGVVGRLLVPILCGRSATTTLSVRERVFVTRAKLVHRATCRVPMRAVRRELECYCEHIRQLLG